MSIDVLPLSTDYLYTELNTCESLFEDLFLWDDTNQINVIQPVDAPENDIPNELDAGELMVLKNKNEIINDNEIVDSTSVTFSSLPPNLEEWTSDHIKQWILSIYNIAKYRYEDLSLQVLNKFNGNLLMNITESDCQHIDKKKSKWLYDSVQLLKHSQRTNSSAEPLDNRSECVMDKKLQRIMIKVCEKFPKSVDHWSPDHVMKWILELYAKSGYKYEHLKLNIVKKYNEKFLINLTEVDCEEIDKNRGRWLFDNIQWIVNYLNKRVELLKNDYSTITTTTQRHSLSISQTSGKKKCGRPRNPGVVRRPEQRIGRVWEFLRNLLLDHKTCPSLIYWQDYSTKTFKLRDGKKIAKLWGGRKNKPNMTYQNFSRTIRHYYKDDIILSVPHQKKVYRFGFNASGVETSNPNFGVPVDI